ncbi:hypothetical protein, partial [Vibrio lentus]
DDYSFWYFEKEGDVDVENRLAITKSRFDEPVFQTAFQIEVQEFMNFLIQPSVSVSKNGGIFRNKKHFTYDFVLPN